MVKAKNSRPETLGLMLLLAVLMFLAAVALYGNAWVRRSGITIDPFTGGSLGTNELKASRGYRKVLLDYDNGTEVSIDINFDNDPGTLQFSILCWYFLFIAGGFAVLLLLSSFIAGARQLPVFARFVIVVAAFSPGIATLLTAVKFTGKEVHTSVGVLEIDFDATHFNWTFAMSFGASILAIFVGFWTIFMKDTVNTPDAPQEGQAYVSAKRQRQQRVVPDDEEEEMDVVTVTNTDDMGV